MQDAREGQRFESRIPPDHPLKITVEATVTDALAAADDWRCRILASTAVTCWVVEFVRSDGQREDVLVQPSRFDHERFRSLVAAALRQ
jgi:hypothetical protein